MSAAYTATARWLHWLMAGWLLALFALGTYMSALPLSPEKLQYYAWHKWAGVLAFALALLRLLWRATHRPPPRPARLSPAVRRSAAAGHALLYGLMLAIPLSGWLMSSAKGFPTVLFGVLPLPDLLARDKALGERLAEVHGSLNLVLLLLVAGHAAAALKHHWVDRDDVLARMLPAARRSR